MKKSDVRARKITKGFTYPLPDSSSETERLIQQSAFINHLRVLSSWKRELRQA